MERRTQENSENMERRTQREPEQLKSNLSEPVWTEQLIAVLIITRC